MEADTALTLLAEHIDNQSIPLKTAAIMRLSVAYAGSHRNDLLTLVLPAVLTFFMPESAV
jgi:26S proteasome regulatory subunit N1